MKYIIAYLLIVNIVAFFMYGVDKLKAKRDSWRIPEKTLIGAALIGGSVGALLGMQVFHHKTKKIKFFLGVPLIFLIQTGMLIYFGYIH